MYRIALLSDAPRAQELIPALSLLSHRVIELPLDSPLSTIGTEHDIVILDARQNLLKARNTAQLLKTAGITIPLMIVLTEGGMAAVSASWQVDDIVLDQASPSEMDARLRLLVTAPELKDTDDRSQQIIRIGNLVIDAQTYSAHLNGAALNLPFKEFELLKFVAQHPGRVFSRAQLLSEVWGYDSYYGGTRTVDVHVRRLRSKLGSEHEQMITTVRNVGYSFHAQNTHHDPSAED